LLPLTRWKVVSVNFNWLGRDPGNEWGNWEHPHSLFVAPADVVEPWTNTSYFLPEVTAVF